jgi:hypothetical protein
VSFEETEEGRQAVKRKTLRTTRGTKEFAEKGRRGTTVEREREPAEKGKRGAGPEPARGAPRVRRGKLECRVFFKEGKSNRIPLWVLLSLPFIEGFPSLGAPPPKVVVLGFDGADHRLVSQWMAEGKLPNLSKLAASGSFSRLRPTIPAQTPVSWSTFSTGLSPGRTMIFDFLKRNPKTYRPEFAIAEEGKKDFLFGKGNRLLVPALLALAGFALGALLVKVFRGRRSALLAGGLVGALAAGFAGVRLAPLLPDSIPTVTSNRRGTPFWEAAGAKGLRSVVMHVPVTFPANDYAGGRLVSGLGVPDVRGRIGTPSFYTSDPFFAPRNKNEFSVELIRLESNTGTIATEVFGPYNKLFPEPPLIKIPMTLTVLPGGAGLRIEP